MTSKREMLDFIRLIDEYLRSGDGDWDITAHHDPEAEAAIAAIRSLIERSDTPAPPAPTAEEAALNRTVTRDCLVPYIVYFHLDDEVLGEHVTEEPKFRWVERMAHDATEALADFRKSLNSKNWVIDEVVPKEPR